MALYHKTSDVAFTSCWSIMPASVLMRYETVIDDGDSHGGDVITIDAIRDEDSLKPFKPV